MKILSSSSPSSRRGGIRYMKGQSLIELLIAVGFFIAVVSVLVFFILDSYASGRLSQEITKATFLAEEGLEAVKSIRDNNWQDLAAGFHGLAVSGNNWIFQGEEEDISQLQEGTRKIIIEDLGPDRKKITSQVLWQFSGERPEEIQMITYLTNWQKVSQAPSGYCAGSVLPCPSFSSQSACFNQDGCSWRQAFCGGACASCSGLSRGQCRQQQGCSWLIVCYGTCTSCDNYLNKNTCQGQSGCSWLSANCSGTAVPCDNYTDEAGCTAQFNCSWTAQ